MSGEGTTNLPSHILSITNKMSQKFKLKHTPFVINTGIENLRGASVIDTGAGVSVVNSEFLERIQKITPDRLKIYEYKAEIRGANNINLGVRGIVYLKLRLGPTSFQHWCLVVDRLPYDLILGNDFIDEYGVIINIQKRLMLIPGQPPIRRTC